MPDQDRVDAVDPERAETVDPRTLLTDAERAYVEESAAESHYTPAQIERVLALMRS